MAGRIYNKQGGSLQGQVINAQVKEATIQPILNVAAQESIRIAQENQAIGKSIALTTALENAYNAAPDSPEQFNKLATDAINKWSENLTPRQKNELQGAFDVKKMAYMAQVGENYNKKQDQEQVRLVGEKAQQDYTGFTSGVQMQWAGFVNGDKNLQDVGYATAQNSLNNLTRLSEIKNRKGEYLYSEKQRSDMSSGQTGQFESFRAAIDGLDYKTLVKFDDEKFMNKVAVQKEFGLTDETYDNMSKYIKQRRKDLDAEDKRTVKAQAVFAANNYALGGDIQSIEQMRKDGLLDNDTAKAMKKVIESPTSDWQAQNVYALEAALLEVKDATNDFTLNQDPEQMTQAWKKFGDRFAQFSQINGLDKQQQQETIDVFTRAMSDQVFADSIRPLFDDSVLTVYLNKNAIRGPEIFKRNIPQTRIPIATQKFGDRDLDQRYAGEVAHNYIRNIVLAGIAGDTDYVKSQLKEANEAVIMAANNSTVGEAEFQRLKRALADGKPALWTHPVSGETYQFKGFTNRDAVFETYNK